jgi:PAS domain S-box-containing protein
VIVDRRGLIVQVNAQVEKLLGYPRSELLGEPVEILIPERYRSKHVLYRADFARQPTSRPMGAGVHLFAKNKAGAELPVEISLSAFGSGDDVLVCAAIRDISDRRAAERALVEARAEAERSSFAKSRLLAVASHDLRQPLQAANMYLHVLSRQFDEPPDVLQKLGVCLGSCASLLDQLLDIAKLEAGATQPVRISCSLCGLQERLGDEVRPMAEAKVLDLRVEPSSAWIDTDPQLLEQLLRNLLVNAVRYTDTGRVLFGARRYGDAVRIEVHDTGIGISADKLGRIFDDFYRVEDPTKQRQGLGLGLGIVRRIAELLQHPVSVDSRPGSGTVFRVTVPVAAARTRTTTELSSPIDTKRVVMVIDDDAAVLEAVHLTIESFGYRVVAVQTQSEALRAARDRASPPDAVVTDLQLGDRTNGLDTLKLMRGVLRRNVPAILLTGDTSNGAVAEGLEVLNKPVQPKDLERALARCVAARAAN